MSEMEKVKYVVERAKRNGGDDGVNSIHSSPSAPVQRACGRRV
jgi:hypothetical protein